MDRDGAGVNAGRRPGRDVDRDPEGMELAGQLLERPVGEERIGPPAVAQIVVERVRELNIADGFEIDLIGRNGRLAVGALQGRGGEADVMQRLARIGQHRQLKTFGVVAPRGQRHRRRNRERRFPEDLDGGIGGQDGHLAGDGPGFLPHDQQCRQPPPPVEFRRQREFLARRAGFKLIQTGQRGAHFRRVGKIGRPRGFGQFFLHGFDRIARFLTVFRFDLLLGQQPDIVDFKAGFRGAPDQGEGFDIFAVESGNTRQINLKFPGDAGLELNIAHRHQIHVIGIVESGGVLDRENAVAEGVADVVGGKPQLGEGRPVFERRFEQQIAGALLAVDAQDFIAVGPGRQFAADVVRVGVLKMQIGQIVRGVEGHCARQFRRRQTQRDDEQ
ncbi:hypothetical protein SDC9_86381 [bioreactor metagenome]|uniref:Uncharacterized protein n=1 Tax=bioreactor metagenome TaxID=1076179 RepID=A0A644ZGA1_9ZZZZ